MRQASTIEILKGEAQMVEAWCIELNSHVATQNMGRQHIGVKVRPCAAEPDRSHHTDSAMRRTAPYG